MLWPATSSIRLPVRSSSTEADFPFRWVATAASARRRSGRGRTGNWEARADRIGRCHHRTARNHRRAVLRHPLTRVAATGVPRAMRTAARSTLTVGPAGSLTAAERPGQRPGFRRLRPRRRRRIGHRRHSALETAASIDGNNILVFARAFGGDGTTRVAPPRAEPRLRNAAK